MNMGYGKAFESTFTGSMVGAGPIVFAVWFYCIANSKPPGEVELNPVLVAAMLGCKVDEVNAAITYLCSPDEKSRTPDEEGRRLIAEGNFLYRMPSWAKYNAIRHEAERREQNRMAQRRRREKLASSSVSNGQQCQPIEDVDEAEDQDVPRTQKRAGAREPSLSRPDDVPEQVWDDWLAHRKAKRGKVSKTALDGLRREAKKAGISLADAMSMTMVRNWQGFSADWVTESRQTRQDRSGRPISVMADLPRVDDEEAIRDYYKGADEIFGQA